MVLDPIPQPLPVHFFGSRPQPPTSQVDTQRRNFLPRHLATKQPFLHISHNHFTIILAYSTQLFRKHANISAYLALLIGSEKSARKLVLRAVLGVWH